MNWHMIAYCFASKCYPGVISFILTNLEAAMVKPDIKVKKRVQIWSTIPWAASSSTDNQLASRVIACLANHVISKSMEAGKTSHRKEPSFSKLYELIMKNPPWKGFWVFSWITWIKKVISKVKVDARAAPGMSICKCLINKIHQIGWIIVATLVEIKADTGIPKATMYLRMLSTIPMM